MIRKGILFAALAIVAVLFVGCSGARTSSPSPQPTITTATPTPTLTATDTPTPVETTVSPESTLEPTATATETDVATTSPEPTAPATPAGNIRLSGTIIYVNHDENNDASSCGRILDVIVDTSGDDVRGIQAVHFHEDDGITIQAQYAQIGDPLEIVIPPEEFDLLVLEHGEEPFPPNSALTSCDDGDIPDELYGEWIAQDVPYNGLTWRNP